MLKVIATAVREREKKGWVKVKIENICFVIMVLFEKSICLPY
jgi:hypothetical protein